MSGERSPETRLKVDGMTDVGMTTTSCCEIRVAASTSCRQCTIAYEFDGLMSPAARAGAVPKNLHTDAKHIPGRERIRSCFFQMIERMTPPSTRNAAPLVAAESGLAMKMTSEATSSIEAKRLSKELGRTVAKNSFSTLDRSMPWE